MDRGARQKEEKSTETGESRCWWGGKLHWEWGSVTFFLEDSGIVWDCADD